MRRVMVRYKVKPDQVEDNERYVRAVYAELKQKDVAELRYATFKLADGVSFVHLASIETEDGKSPLNELAAFKAFQAELKDRCDEPPMAVDITEVGSYRFFED